jgi:hypothetical protein
MRLAREQQRLRRLRRAMATKLAAVHPRHQGFAVMLDAASRRLFAAYGMQNEFCRAD